MAITGSQLARITDATNISITATVAEMDELVKQAKIHSFGVAVGPQCYVPYLLQQLSGYDTKILGAAGGRATERTEDKVAMALNSRALGCGEIESRMNLSYLKSGMYDEIVKETRAIKDAIGEDRIFKCIIETPLLTDEEITTACELLIDGGVDFVKSATGTMGATTLHHVEVMGKAIKGRVGIKAAGGVRTIEMVDQMMDAGVTRFGIGLASALKIIAEADNR